ncbi:MAG: 5'/3'-nucleotidase SurE [Rhabdochlamydiaceae bacterium]|jgi:5'-nucleotidase
MNKTSKRPKILITNDDGIFSMGLKCLWQALVEYADLFIIAPGSDQSGSGLGFTLRVPLQIDKVKWEQNTPAWKVNGTPVDCVKLGLSVILKEKPDLVVSGINHASNAGRTVLYSGTVGGAIEGVLRNIPSIAFSFEDIDAPDYSQAQKYIHPIVQHVLEHPLPKGTLLNVNFPYTSTDFKGIKLARQGRSYWIDTPHERIHPEGTPYFWLGGKWDEQEEHPESDVALLKEGYITVVPIHVDELTDHEHLEERKASFEKSFPLL